MCKACSPSVLAYAMLSTGPKIEELDDEDEDEDDDDEEAPTLVSQKVGHSRDRHKLEMPRSILHAGPSRFRFSRVREHLF